MMEMVSRKRNGRSSGQELRRLRRISWIPCATSAPRSGGDGSVEMIPNQWYVVLGSQDVKRGKMLGVTRLGERLVFARDQEGKAFCLRDRCAHRGAALSAGKLLEDRIQCPFHGFEYDARGRGARIPANGRDAPVPDRFHVCSYPIHESHGFIWIWWGENPPTNLKEPSFFDDIDGTFHSRPLCELLHTLTSCIAKR